MSLPSIASIHDAETRSESLERALTVLFEHSNILTSNAVPQLAETLPKGLATYHELIDISLSLLTKWDATLRAQFIAGHPRIGQVKQLSNLSAKEQGNLASPELLARLEHLNLCYERRYPGLRYITFVNGRSRAVIAEEMEDKLGFEHSLSATEPNVGAVELVELGGVEWTSELDRAMKDIGLIAKSRLSALGIE